MISRRLPIPNPSHDRGAGGFLFCALCSAAIEAMRAKLVAALPKADVKPTKRRAS